MIYSVRDTTRALDNNNLYRYCTLQKTLYNIFTALFSLVAKLWAPVSSPDQEKIIPDPDPSIVTVANATLNK
jgi:hypothetical protein